MNIKPIIGFKYKYFFVFFFKLYEALAKEKVLKLQWKCPGRHLPKAEKSQEDVEMKEDVKPEPVEQPKEDSK